MLATVWQILNMKHMQRLKMEIMGICWNLPEKLVKSHQVRLILDGFSHLEPLCWTALPSQLCPPDWGRASSRSWTAWCGGSQHCETLKRHGRSLSVVQLRGFVREVCSTEPLKIVFTPFFLSIVIDEKISIFVALYRCCWRLDWWLEFIDDPFLLFFSSCI